MDFGGLDGMFSGGFGGWRLIYGEIKGGGIADLGSESLEKMGRICSDTLHRCINPAMSVDVRKDANEQIGLPGR